MPLVVMLDVVSRVYVRVVALKLNVALLIDRRTASQKLSYLSPTFPNTARVPLTPKVWSTLLAVVSAAMFVAIALTVPLTDPVMSLKSPVKHFVIRELMFPVALARFPSPDVELLMFELKPELLQAFPVERMQLVT